ncbi:hypothetical protein B0H21DRAFT_733207 [Amylocystis lapponica]|nr:hypothetical protein B0H21DRAFT_733207 [Amylocystis lapponica]
MGNGYSVAREEQQEAEFRLLVEAVQTAQRGGGRVHTDLEAARTVRVPVESHGSNFWRAFKSLTGAVKSTLRRGSTTGEDDGHSFPCPEHMAYTPSQPVVFPSPRPLLSRASPPIFPTQLVVSVPAPHTEVPAAPFPGVNIIPPLGESVSSVGTVPVHIRRPPYSEDARSGSPNPPMRTSLSPAARGAIQVAARSHSSMELSLSSLQTRPSISEPSPPAKPTSYRPYHSRSPSRSSSNDRGSVSIPPRSSSVSPVIRRLSARRLRAQLRAIPIPPSLYMSSAATHNPPRCYMSFVDTPPLPVTPPRGRSSTRSPIHMERMHMRQSRSRSPGSVRSRRARRRDTPDHQSPHSGHWELDEPVGRSSRLSGSPISQVRERTRSPSPIIVRTGSRRTPSRSSSRRILAAYERQLAAHEARLMQLQVDALEWQMRDQRLVNVLSALEQRLVASPADQEERRMDATSVHSEKNQATARQMEPSGHNIGFNFKPYPSRAVAAGLHMPMRAHSDDWCPAWTVFPLKVFRGADYDVLKIPAHWDDEALLRELGRSYNRLRKIWRKWFSLKMSGRVGPAAVSPSKNMRLRWRHEFMRVLTAQTDVGIEFIERWQLSRIAVAVMVPVWLSLVLGVVYTVLTEDASTAFTIAVRYVTSAYSVCLVLVGALNWIDF